MNVWNSERARKLEAQSGLKRKWIASKCGVSTKHLGQVINGRSMPSDTLLIVLAQTLNTNVDFLTCKSDDQRPSKEVA